MEEVAQADTDEPRLFASELPVLAMMNNDNWDEVEDQPCRAIVLREDGVVRVQAAE